MEGGDKKVEIKLVNEGTYGCIYRPGITCDGKQETAKYITKIQKNKRAIQNELTISNKIRNITGYTRFFAPILKQCGVKITKDTAQGLKQCEVFENDTIEDIADYVSTKIRYVGNQDLMKYLLSELQGSKFHVEVWKTHTYLLKALQKLVAKNIVHYDIKYNNIIYDNGLSVPIFIDFGLAFSSESLGDASSDLEKIFFVFEYYSWWPIDVVMCSYIIQQIGKTESKTAIVSAEQLEEVYDVFLRGTQDPQKDQAREVKNDVFRLQILNSEEKQAQFRKAYEEYFTKFVGQKWWSVYENMIKYVDTWDNYSVAATYLVILDDAASANPIAYQSNKNSAKYGAYIDLLESIVYSSPENRPSLKDSLKRIPKLI